MEGGAGKSRVVVSRGGDLGEAHSVRWIQRARLRLQIGCWAFYVLRRASSSILVAFRKLAHGSQSVDGSKDELLSMSYSFQAPSREKRENGRTRA